MKLLKRSLILLLVIVGLLFYFIYPRLTIITGYAAKNMASGVFIADRSEVSITNNDNNIPFIKLAETEVDKPSKKAFASLYGLITTEAVYRDGLGSVLVGDDFDPNKPMPKPNRNRITDTTPYPYGQAAPLDTVFPELDLNQLDKAIISAFSNPEIQRTRTVLVLYKGNLVAEKYVDGFSPDTPILGWSMAKSVLATCFGILEHQGKLDVNWPAPVTEWERDERKNITLNHLLRMQSGLEWDEDYSSVSDVTRMLFMESDMTKSQRGKPLIAPPGEVWNYSSGTTNLLSGILRQQFRSHQEYLDFPYAALIDKIGMHSMLLEADRVGNYVGSSYAWANTRDWGRFGQLYLDKGLWNGEQLFDPAWSKYVSTPTMNSKGDYGAHFRLNAGDKYPDVPKDLYYCSGHLGQYVFIIPSRDLVVVRTGLAKEPEFDINSFLSEVVESVHYVDNVL